MDPQKELDMKAPPTEELFGVAKKFSLELEKYPLHSHATVVQMMNTSMQHRKMELESQVEQKNRKAQEEAMNAAREAHAKQTVASMVANSRPTLVTEETAKEPRVLVSTER